MAKAKKKTSANKRSAKKVRKPLRAGTGAAKKAAKKAGRVVKAKKVAKKAAKKTAKKTAKKITGKANRKTAKPPAAKTPAKKHSAFKTGSTKPVAAPTPAKAAKPPARKPKAGAAPDRATAVPEPPAAAERNSYYITTAIAYPNGVPHIGHAYEAIATDALARFQRLDGKDVFFLTGTDEHGLKMIQTAQAEGMTPLDLADAQCRPVQADGPAPQHLVRPVHPHLGARASSFGPGDLEADAAGRRYLSRQIFRLVFGARRGLLRRRGNRGRRRPGAPWPAGHAGGVGRGEKLFLPTVGLSGQAAGALRRRSRISSGRIRARNEVISFVKGGLEGSVDLAHHLRLGGQGARATPNTSCMSGSMP